MKLGTKALVLLVAVFMLGDISQAKTQRGKARVASEHKTSTHQSRSSAKVSRSSKKHGKKALARHRGQAAISSDRTREIQAALIREHYLDGEPSGVLDQRTRQALVKFQQDNGWQTKVVPDSRALIKLGLGPNHDGLLNPESAAISNPHRLGIEKPIPGGSNRD